MDLKEGMITKTSTRKFWEVKEDSYILVMWPDLVFCLNSYPTLTSALVNGKKS